MHALMIKRSSIVRKLRSLEGGETTLKRFSCKHMNLNLRRGVKRPEMRKVPGICGIVLEMLKGGR